MNDNEKYIEEFVKNVPFDAPDGGHRDELKKQLLSAYPKHRLQPTAHTVKIWKIIMKGRISRLTAAAVIIFAAFLALNFFDQKSGIVWADVVKRLEDIKTAAYRITTDIKGFPGTPEGYTTHITQDVTLSYEQGAVRIDSSLQVPSGTRKTHTYILFEDSVLITVMPARKKYRKVIISDEQMQKMEDEKGDPVTLLKAMLEHEYTDLGRKTIDGVAAWGIEVSDPKLGMKMGYFISGGMFDDTTVQLWVDEKDELPIRINATGSSKDGQASMETVYDSFDWGIEIEPALLKPEIPNDYELMTQGKWETGKEGEEIIEVLRLFVEYADGKYPASLKTMTVAKAIAPALRKKFPPGSPEPSKELLARFMKVDRVGMMYTTLEKDGKDPAYYGDKVSAEFPEAVLFRWKINDDTYRVVFGDLSTEDVSAEKLAELEAAPLNPNPYPINPKPTDGTVGTELKGLKLSWMLAAYATKHKVYFGTSAEKMSLLSVVEDPGCDKLPVLRRDTTYYWRVDAVHADSSIEAGDIWSFNTGELVGWWKLDEGSGTTAADSGDKGLDGSLVGDTSWVDGIAAGALAFDGDGDYVDLGKDPAFDITNQITVSAWIKVDAFDRGWQTIIARGDSAWRLQRNYGNNTLEFACDGLVVPGTRWGKVSGTADVNDGRWHHVVGTYDGSKICLYADGKLDVSSTASGTIKINDQPVYIGENSERPERFWNGLIDDVRLYSYALTADEIAAITQNTAVLLFK